MKGGDNPGRIAVVARIADEGAARMLAGDRCRSICDRLVGLQDGQVCFRWKDYAHGPQWRTIKLSTIEFVRRFLMDLLPSGFVRVRHYGILANRHRQERLALCRELLGVVPTSHEDVPAPLATPEHGSPVTPTTVCPVCGAGQMIVIAEFPPMAVNLENLNQTKLCLIFDTS